MAKAMPLDFDGKAQHYRDYRRRLELVRKLCKRRGTDCESEGGFTLLQCLPKFCWEATRHLDFDVVDGVDGFGKIIGALERLYRYDDSVEAPIRCQEYFEKFCRKPDETLNEYESRERVAHTAEGGAHRHPRRRQRLDRPLAQRHPGLGGTYGEIVVRRFLDPR